MSESERQENSSEEKLKSEGGEDAGLDKEKKETAAAASASGSVKAASGSQSGSSQKKSGEGKGKGKASFWKGVKTEFKKVIWPKKNVLVKQSGVVMAVSIIVGAMIAVIDRVVLIGIDLLVK